MESEEKEAKKAYNREYYIKNKAARQLYRLKNSDKIREYQKAYFSKDREKWKQYRREYVKNNRSLFNKINSRYKQKNIDKIRLQKREYDKNRYQNDTNFRIAFNLRRRIRIRIKLKAGGKKAGSAVRDLGCTIRQFKLHIESQFKTGMGWSNYGAEWHIDHIKPLCKFDLADREQFLEACHFSNMQPLWAKENWEKGSKYDACPI